MSNIIETIQISGFDAEGEPEIHIHEDKTILLEFSFMPPSDVETEEDEAIYEDFDEQIEGAIGSLSSGMIVNDSSLNHKLKIPLTYYKNFLPLIVQIKISNKLWN